MDRVTAIYDDLRRLAASDPRRARLYLNLLLDQRSADLPSLVEHASVPGEGRVRQLFANALRMRGQQAEYADVLRGWLRSEPDEFTKRALEAALVSLPVVPTTRSESGLVPSDQLRIYRYISDRLKHQIRNALMEPKGKLIRLRNLLRSEPQSHDSLLSHLRDIEDTIDDIARLVGFDNGDGYFTMRPILLGEWLKAYGSKYSSRFTRVALDLQLTHSDCHIIGSDFALETIFWNLFVNAQQAIPEGRVEVRIVLSPSGDKHSLVISDNGDGLPVEAAGHGLTELKPRKLHTGRGLLEVAESVEGLHGTSEIATDADGKARLLLTFPTVTQ